MHPVHHIGTHIRGSNSAITIDQLSRFQHTYVIGKTGTGKSTFSKNSFLQDVYAGYGGCYFDFHGQDAPWLLDYIPRERVQDVIYFDPLDATHAIGYNVFNGVAPEDYAVFTDDIVEMFRHIHRASWGARMDDILTNAIRPLFDLPPESEGTLLGVVRMLNDTKYRNWVLKQTTERTVKDFWFQEFAGWSKPEQGHNLNSSLNKIRRLQSSPILRNILGQQKSRIDFDRAMADGKLIILNLNKWRIGSANANLLGSLFVTRLLHAASHRPLPLENENEGDNITLPPFFITIDEFQNVTTLATIEGLTGIRKFCVGMTVGHQYERQLSEQMVDAVKGNVGTTVVFRVGADDAYSFYRHVGVPEATHLSDQYDYHFTVHMKSGTNTATHRGYTEPLAFEHQGYADAIRATARAKYSLPIDVVEAKYQRWQNTTHYGHAAQPKPTGRATRRTGTGLRSMREMLKERR